MFFQLATDLKYANVAHQLDVWHKSNKLDKKLMEVLGKLLMHFYIDFVFKLSFLQASKKSENLVLRDWVAATRNHFWHCSKECSDDLGTMKVR